MGVQPKDLISTLPQLHERSVVPLPQLPSSPPPPYSQQPCPPSPLAPGAQRIPMRNGSLTENGTLETDDSPRSVDPVTPVTSSVPAASRGAKFFKKKSKKARSMSTDADQYLQSRLDTSTMRRDHFSPLETAAKCCDKNCLRRFSWKDRKRNCRMCGEVFCRKCTKFLRKLSQHAEPDPLGVFCNVCEKCYNVNLRSGRYRDLKYEFDQFRVEARREMISKAALNAQTPLPARMSSKSKSDQVRAEIDRLVRGFESQGIMKGLVGTPNWQKSINWVPDSKANECFQSACRKRFRLGVRKINCRVCGQVFCRDCTKSEVLLYCLYKNSPASWAINGKEGGPTSKPHRFETYPICAHCCSELEAILLTEIDGAPPTPEPVFPPNCLSEIALLQAELASSQRNVEQYLPVYEQLVDTLGIDDSSPHSVDGDHPLRALAKAQADLSDTFTHMANRSQALKRLTTTTEAQKRLLQHIMMGMYNFYQDYMFLFKSTQVRLKEMIPIESLDTIQEFLDQQSMERVHLTLRQLTYELLNIEKTHKCTLDFTRYLVQADMALEDELRPFLERRDESWEKHLACVKEFVQDSFKKRPYIKLQKDIPRKGTNYKSYIRYYTLERTKSILAKCVRELEVKAREEAFLETKSSLAKAGAQVSKELKTFTDVLSPK